MSTDKTGKKVGERDEATSVREIEEMLTTSGALTRGHFRLSSGLHSPAYVQCALLLEEPRRGTRVGRALARTVASLRPTSVVAPAMGGLLVGYEVAAALGMPFRFVERAPDGGGMTMRRGFRLSEGERVVIVEDVVTTGKSTREAMAVVREQGAETVAVASIIDRTGDANPFDVPHLSLLELTLPTYDPDDCPLCAEGVPVERPGSRPDGLAEGA